jgi:predicted TIM-barrel fold metal-dependent hydrolase
VSSEQARYVGGTAALKHTPSEYLTGGRFFCSVERQEGEDMFNTVIHYLGDGVLLYASDYPHSECQFPQSIDNILAWPSLKPDTRKKLLWDNANLFSSRPDGRPPHPPGQAPPSPPQAAERGFPSAPP